MKVKVRAKNSSSWLGWSPWPPPHLFVLHPWEYLRHVCKLSFFTKSATTSAPLYWLQALLKEFLTHPKYFTKCRTMLDNHSYNLSYKWCCVYETWIVQDHHLLLINSLQGRRVCLVSTHFIILHVNCDSSLKVETHRHNSSIRLIPRR